MSISGYKPLYIKKIETGLVQNRLDFLLTDDAYPILENMVIFREKIVRKKGYELLGRLRRKFTATSIGNSGASPWSFNLFTALSINLTTEPDASFEAGSVRITIGANTIQDQGNGTFTTVAGITGTINYRTGNVVITGTGAGGVATTVTSNYFPALPVMGLLARDTDFINVTSTLAFDTKYAYIYNTGFQEFIVGTTWTGTDVNFFWPTNYWQSNANLPLFWVTNYSGPTGDPIRYTDGASWTDFAPVINSGTGDVLAQCLAMLPFRGRLLAFSTIEGPNLAGGKYYYQRIRWSAIGSPLTTTAWYDDVRGQGGYLDIPTSELITTVGFVRDNLVIYCEKSTWQLRYTGRSISPFQIEKVNSELGADAPFSLIQFDTSLVGIGGRGVVECDSYKSNRIDIKIPDLVFNFNNANNGPQRVYGVRDFDNRLAYWTYPYQIGGGATVKYPNRRLVYNYENDSWGIYTDSLTCLGFIQRPSGRTWLNVHKSWEECNFTWGNGQSGELDIVGGNQQGYVEYLDTENEEGNSYSDVSLFIENITGHVTTATVITSPNHNLQTGQVIQILDIPSGTPFDNLNSSVFAVDVIDVNNFSLYLYDSVTGGFTKPQKDTSATYIGGGQILVRDNFNCTSKKFNFADQGQNIQMGYIDVLMASTNDGAVTLNIYLNYNDSEPVNTSPQNTSLINQQPDPFFNVTVPTSNNTLNGVTGSKYWQRVYCNVRGNFLTLQWTLSNAQMAGNEQPQEVEIDAEVLWLRPAGRMTNF